MSTGITFRAWRGDNYISLAAILSLLGDTVAEFLWQVRTDGVAPHPLAPSLEAVSPEAVLTTKQLIGLLDDNVQIIDGEITGRAEAGAKPQIAIAAIDSTSWDVVASDESLLRRLIAEYPDAVPIPTSELPW